MKKTIFLSVILSLVAFITLTISTFAWFTQQNFVFTEMYTAEVNGDEIELLISLSETDEYDVECELIPDNIPKKLLPVSTGDLQHFFKPMKMLKNGVATEYKEIDKTESVIYGTLFLKANEDCDVYIDEENFDISLTGFVSAGLRLGLEINNEIYIFNLDKGENKEARITTEKENVVVMSAEGKNTSYVTDPSLPIDDYYLSGGNKIATLLKDEPTAVRYWIYIEGCDINCVNNIIDKDINIKFAFTGENTWKRYI